MTKERRGKIIKSCWETLFQELYAAALISALVNIISFEKNSWKLNDYSLHMAYILVIASFVLAWNAIATFVKNGSNKLFFSFVLFYVQQFLLIFSIVVL